MVAEPSMTKIAISFSLLNPITTASGMNTATNPTNLINAAITVGLILPNAFLISKVAPIAISPIGVATPPILLTALCKITGIGSFSADHNRPAAIPMMIGFVMIPVNVFLSSALSIPFCPGLKNDSTTTAIIL